jgi:hypothetical protein
MSTRFRLIASLELAAQDLVGRLKGPEIHETLESTR